MSDRIELLRWKYGGRLDFWAKNAKLVGRFIETARLKSATPEALVKQNPAVQTYAKKQEMSLRSMPVRKLPNGGWPLPHLHLGDKFYVLNDKQWKSFTSMMMKEFEQNLERARNVNFEQVISISTAVDTILKR